MSAELNKQTALALGWIQKNLPNIGLVWYKPNGGLSLRPPTGDMLEDEIERRGLQELYLEWLLALATDKRHSDWSANAAWVILRATPENRAQAFLEAIKQS